MPDIRFNINNIGIIATIDLMVVLLTNADVILVLISFYNRSIIVKRISLNRFLFRSRNYNYKIDNS